MMPHLPKPGMDVPRIAYLRQRIASRPSHLLFARTHLAPFRPYSYQPPTSNAVPTSTYRPPTLPKSPSSYSSSGIPDSSHPMPDDMPREDYAAPTAYTMSMLGKILRYVIYGTVGLGLSTLIGVEGLHQYVENVALAHQSHSPYLDNDPTSPTSSQTIPSTSPSYFAWTEDPSNTSWTGPSSSGGTSSTLSWRTRHALRSAWIALEWGAGSTGSSMIAREPSSLHHGSQAGLKGMIGQNSGRGQGQNGGGTINKIDTGFAIAEAYLATAIELAQNQDGIEFPPHLSINRSEYPEPESISGARPRPNRVAVDMLLRHAEVLERMGTSLTLHKASETYERVLRSLSSLSPPTPPPSPSSPSTNGPSSISATTLSADLNEAQRHHLTQKISDIHARMGDLQGAKGWSAWGVEQLGMGAGVGLSVSSGLVEAVKPNAVGEVEVGSRRAKGWFGGMFGGAKESSQQRAMEHTLSVNSTPVTTFTTPTINLLSRPVSPALLRSIISLLSSHSTHLAFSGDLPSAATYQTAALDLIQPLSIQTFTETPTVNPDAQLHRLWLSQRKGLLEMHLAEVNFARGQDPEDALRVLSRSCVEGEDVIRELTTGRKSRSKPITGEAAQVDLGKVEEIRNIPIASVFASKGQGGRTDTIKPAQRLLKDAQRSTAENWSLLGLLYEQQALSSSSTGTITTTTTDSSHHAQETALDCYERAIGWSRVAYGGTFSGVQDLGDELDEMGGDGISVGYQRSYERLRGRMEAGMKAGKATA